MCTDGRTNRCTGECTGGLTDECTHGCPGRCPNKCVSECTDKCSGECTVYSVIWLAVTYQSTSSLSQYFSSTFWHDVASLNKQFGCLKSVAELKKL